VLDGPTMERRFVVEDELHAEQMADFPTFEGALAHLEQLAQLPWHEEPNAAPCGNGEACGRRFEIVEYDVTARPWATIARHPALEVSAKGLVWDRQLPRHGEGKR
jgi:hypothetical protein